MLSSDPGAQCAPEGLARGDIVMATLRVTQDTDYRIVRLPLNITSIVFDAPLDADFDTTDVFFNASQFGGFSRISDSVQITGDFQIDDVRVFLSGSQNFSAAGWTFVRWHGGNGWGADHDVIHLFGSDGANTITGSSENDIIQGFGSADILNGGDGNDTFVYAGTDQLVAGEVVNGGSGTDTLLLSSGFNVNSIAFDFTIATLSSIEALEFFAGGTRSATFTDTQFEGTITTLRGAGAGGDDTVIINGTDSVVDVSALTFVNWNDASDSITINGTANQDLLIGSAHRDTLNGGGNNDLLLGGLGDDTLDGGAGNDVLTGAGGNDTMIGGPGDDNYTVQDVGDVVSENANEGTDTVNASITFSIAALANFENLTLMGSANINGTGNSGVNTITGNSGNNTLDGRGGNDTLDGGLGNDTLIGNGGIDTASYHSHDGGPPGGPATVIPLGLGGATGSYVRTALGSGQQQVIEKDLLSGIENVTGSNGHEIIIGNELDNVLDGRGDNDTIDGGLGNDIIIGGSGTDDSVSYASHDSLPFLSGELMLISLGVGGADGCYTRLVPINGVLQAVETDVLRGIEGVDGSTSF